jgi:hypothetical protein
MKRTLLIALILGLAQAAFAGCMIGSTKINTSPVAATTFNDSVVVDGNSYYYQATAVDANGFESACSNTSNRADIPSTGTHSVTLTWTASSGATGYNIYRVVVPVPPINFSGTWN